MRNKAKLFIFALVVTTFHLTGCATSKSIQMSAENRASIKYVHIYENVSKPSVIYWRGTAQAWGAALGGVIGALATNNSGMTDAERMVKYLDKEHIDISEMVYFEATKQEAALKTFDISDANKIDATLSFTVDMYGFNKTHPFGSNMNPLIRVTGKLVRPDNQIVWQDSEFVSDLASENDQGQSLDTYQNEPEKLRAALAKASEIAVKRVLAKLQ
jgi:hypothetical protein